MELPKEPAPLPAGQSVFEHVRETCAAAMRKHGALVQVDEAAARSWASQVDLGALKAAFGMDFPLRFESVDVEVSFRVALHLLSFGSGYEHLLREHLDRSAREVVSFGVMGMYISTGMHADALVQASLHSISEVFQIPVDVDVEIQPAVYTTRPHPLRPLADRLRYTINRAGAALRALGAHELAAAVANLSAGGNGSADYLVRGLVRSFPSFDDREADGPALLSKVQLLVGDLHRRFAAADPRFAFPDVAGLTLAAEPEVGAALRGLGLVRVVDPALQERLEAGTTFKPDEPAVEALRAATVACGDVLIAALRERQPDIQAYQLQDYLRELAVSDPLQRVPRERTPDTVYY